MQKPGEIRFFAIFAPQLDCDGASQVGDAQRVHPITRQVEIALSARTARRALRSPTASLHEFLSQYRVLEVAAGDPNVLRNLNTATDLNDYQMSTVLPRSRTMVRTQRQ